MATSSKRLEIGERSTSGRHQERTSDDLWSARLLLGHDVNRSLLARELRHAVRVALVELGFSHGSVLELT